MATDNKKGVGRNKGQATKRIIETTAARCVPQGM